MYLIEYIQGVIIMKFNQFALATFISLSSLPSFAANYNFNVAPPSFAYGSNEVGAGAFTDTWTFNVSGSLDVDGVLSNFAAKSINNIDFTAGGVTLNGVVLDVTNIGKQSLASLDSTVLSGPLTLVVNGTSAGKGTYSLNFNIAAVPEPETYALMIAGLSLVGFAARKKKQIA
jgi:hypothetical protein